MNNLFQILFGGNIKKKKNCNLTNSSIKRFARKAGIMYLPKNTYDNIRKIFNNKFKKTLSELENITELRNGKIITSNDFQFYILKKKYEKLYNKYHNSNFIGGNDNPSYCDGPTNLTQCMDSLDTCNTQRGGQSTKNKDLNFLFPHKTFKRYLKEYKNTDFKISNKFAIKLHLYLENYIHHTLVKASLLENKSKNLKISLDKFL